MSVGCNTRCIRCAQRDRRPAWRREVLVHVRSCLGLYFMMPSLAMTTGVGDRALRVSTVRSVATAPRTCARRPLWLALWERRARARRCACTAGATAIARRRARRPPSRARCTPWAWSSAHCTLCSNAIVLFVLLDFVHPCLFQTAPSLVFLVVETKVGRRLSRGLSFIRLRLRRYRWRLALDGCVASPSLALPIAALPRHPAVARRSGRPRTTSRLRFCSPRINIWSWHLRSLLPRWCLQLDAVARHHCHISTMRTMMAAATDSTTSTNLGHCLWPLIGNRLWRFLDMRLLWLHVNMAVRLTGL